MVNWYTVYRPYNLQSNLLFVLFDDMIPTVEACDIYVASHESY